jgi:tetraacyldisaccharide 4'-kinase
VYNWIHKVWYEGAGSYRLLLPLTALYWLIVSLRRWLYRCGALKQHDCEVPVIVVGNITAGGTGKTPTTVWLAQQLRKRGFRPGLVSRGYGGSKSKSPMRVDAGSDPAVVGDEPVLLAIRAECPVVVDADRVRAAAMLAGDGMDVIIADDGLQHYRLGRDYEICVIDGSRGLGNRLMLPAGPLRESARRLYEVDQVLVNGSMRQPVEILSEVEQNALEFNLVATEACRLNGSLIRRLDAFAGMTVHGVAAIGNPARFFDLLRNYGIQVIEHAYPDHASLSARDLDFADEFDILMTEKDAVKFGANASDRTWYVAVELDMDPVTSGPWLEQIESRLRAGEHD